ncbi:MAG: hypothetical protein JW732_04530 [Dehalococcoidia bacterium]|nr:hypothetical protein [Dehalococcoidia bacterium]
MKWRGLSSRTRWALVMMLVAIFPTVAGVIIGVALFGETAPPFVYAFPAIWLILFLVSLQRLKAGLIGGIVWAVINLFAPLIIALQGLRSSLAQALGIPVCPFSIVGAVISAVIIYLCLRAYKEVTPAAA